MKAVASFSLDVTLLKEIQDRAKEQDKDRSEVAGELMIAGLEAEREGVIPIRR